MRDGGHGGAAQLPAHAAARQPRAARLRRRPLTVARRRHVRDTQLETQPDTELPTAQLLLKLVPLFAIWRANLTDDTWDT